MRINPLLKKTAILAAENSGRILKNRFQKPLKVSRKTDLSFVTQADLESNHIIEKIIKKNFPRHAIISEENKNREYKEYTWVIDPLDGTTNYVAGIPFFSVSLAVLYNKNPILGIVFNPASKEFYCAEKNMGAYLNQKRIRLNKIDNLAASRICFNRGKDLAGGINVLAKIAPHINSFRTFGSANLEICQVAAGRFEGYITSRAQYYDCAAGNFIAREAGAKITDFHGKEYALNSPNLIVSNAKTNKLLLNIINERK